MYLGIHTSKNAAETTHYFIGKKSLESYYSVDGQEFAGFWGGKIAPMLGLEGRFTDEAFARLVHNRHPITGERLTPRMRADRRPGFDLTFNAPKSVSLVYAWTKDERIIRAFRETCWEIMERIEERAAARVRSGGRNEDRITGKILWAEIIHLTARPEGGLPDPHLHGHLYVPNLTWDDVEKKFKALQMGFIHEEADFYQRAATLLFAEKLKKLGFDIVPTKDAFEIAGISRDLIEKFSRRTKTIEAYAQKHGITDPAQKARLAVLTRGRKGKSLLISELEPFWWGNLLPEEKQALEANATRLRRSRATELSCQIMAEPPIPQESSKSFGTRKDLPNAKSSEIAPSSEWFGSRDKVKGGASGRRQSMNQKTKPRLTVDDLVTVTEHDRRAVALAVEHVFERRSAVTEMQLIAEASRNWCVGRATLRGIEKVVAEAPLIRHELDGRTFVTTAEVVTEERQIAQRCLAGKGRWEAMNPRWKIEDETLNDEQRNAVMHVLRSRDFITAIAGRAGVGKTTLLNELKSGMLAGFNKVIALAPTSEAARDGLRNEGFTNAETVAKLLKSELLQESAKGAVLLVDEAGLLSTRDADRLIALAAKLDARLIFVGDTLQHQPVARGQAFEHLQKEGGMEVASVSKIMRQKGVYKRFVEHLLSGDIERAFMSLDVMDAIQEMTLAERKTALSNDYVSSIERGKSALVVAPTHAERADVTEGIREALKAKGTLKGGTQWDVLRNLSWTEAQKSDSDHYKNKKGLVVQINDHVKGFALGEQVEVIYEDKCRSQSTDDGMVRVRCKNGYDWNIRALPLSEPETFSVYERDKLEICEGDRIRITGNGKSTNGHRLTNGKIHRVDYISHDGLIVLENGWKLERDFKHVDYGYCLTSHAAQGKTVDCVFVAQTAQLSSCASDLRQFYVSTSRGREGVKIYTDDIELLKENVSQVRERPMATEILRKHEAEAAPERSGEPFGQEGPKIEAELAEIFREYDGAEAEMKNASVSALLGREKEIQIEAMERAMEREAEMELEMEM